MAAIEQSSSVIVSSGNPIFFRLADDCIAIASTMDKERVVRSKENICQCTSALSYPERVEGWTYDTKKRPNNGTTDKFYCHEKLSRQFRSLPEVATFIVYALLPGRKRHSPECQVIGNSRQRKAICRNVGENPELNVISLANLHKEAPAEAPLEEEDNSNLREEAPKAEEEDKDGFLYRIASADRDDMQEYQHRASRHHLLQSGIIASCDCGCETREFEGWNFGED